MSLVYVIKLSPTIQKANIGVQKIDNLSLEIYNMISIMFSLQNNLRKVWFFEKTFLLANTHIEVVLRISFLSFYNINIEFIELEKLTRQFYSIIEALSITNRVKLIDKWELLKVALDRNSRTFVICIAALKIPTIIPIYLFKAF